MWSDSFCHTCHHYYHTCSKLLHVFILKFSIVKRIINTVSFISFHPLLFSSFSSSLLTTLWISHPPLSSSPFFFLFFPSLGLLFLLRFSSSYFFHPLLLTSSSTFSPLRFVTFLLSFLRFSASILTYMSINLLPLFLACRFNSSLDCITLKPIYKGSPSIKCSYCGSVSDPSHKDEPCANCTLSTVRNLVEFQQDLQLSRTIFYGISEVLDLYMFWYFIGLPQISCFY